MVEHLAVLCLICSHYLIIYIACLLGYSLTCDIHQVVAEIGIGIHLMRSFHQKLCCPDNIIRIVIFLHLRPRRHLIGIQRRTRTKYRLMTSLLHNLGLCSIYRLCKQEPCLLHLRIVYPAITCLHIIMKPFFPYKFAVAPWQLCYKFIHHRIVLYAFHSKAYSFECRSKIALTRLIVLIYHMLQFTIQSYIASIIKQHAESPVMSVETFLAIP